LEKEEPKLNRRLGEGRKSVDLKEFPVEKKVGGVGWRVKSSERVAPDSGKSSDILLSRRLAHDLPLLSRWLVHQIIHSGRERRKNSGNGFKPV
jgi:hypothetical protein